MDTIGIRIKALREDMDMSQKELALKANITEATLSRYENDLREPKVSAIIRLAKELHTTTDFLLGTSDNPQPDTGENSLGLREIRLLKLYGTLSAINKVRLMERAQTLVEIQSDSSSGK